jgi:hypothetical protein
MGRDRYQRRRRARPRHSSTIRSEVRPVPESRCYRLGPQGAKTAHCQPLCSRVGRDPREIAEHRNAADIPRRPQSRTASSQGTSNQAGRRSVCRGAYRKIVALFDKIHEPIFERKVHHDLILGSSQQRPKTAHSWRSKIAHRAFKAANVNAPESPSFYVLRPSARLRGRVRVAAIRFFGQMSVD